MKNCTNCAEQMDDQATVCPKCGVAQQPVAQQPVAPVAPQPTMAAQPAAPQPTPGQPAQPVPPVPPQPGVQPNNMYTQPNNMYSQPNMPQNNMYVPPMQAAPYDSGSFGWAVLGFFFPLIGLILFLVWKDSKPFSSKKAGIGALVGFILGIVFIVLVYVIIFAAIGASGYYYY